MSYIHYYFSIDAVDVNVTPDKRQVFMQEEKLLLAIIKSSLKNMFDTGTSTYQVNQKPLNQLNLSVIRNHEQSTENDENGKQTHPDKESSIAGNLSVTCFPSLKSFKRPYSLISSESDVTREPKQAKLTNVRKETTVSNSEESNELEQSLDDTSSGCDACENNSDLFIICKDGLKSDSNAAVILEDELHIPEKQTRKQNIDEEECETKTCEVNNVSTNVIDLSLKSPPRKQEVEIVEPNITDKTPTPFKLNSQCKRQDLKEIVKGRKTLCIDFSIARFKKPVDVKKNEQKLETTARLFREKISPENNNAAEEELTKNITKESFAKMEILGQFNLGFILTKLGDDLFIVDQHASDEKYNFEYQQKHTSLNTQRLIIPQKLELTAANECVLMENIDIFRKNGFEFEIDDEAEATKKTKLISVPVSKNWTFGVEDVEELIFMLSDSPGVMCRPTRVRKMFASRACRMSIMVGTALSREQMKMIINHMGDMDHPWNCPHGRPTMRHVINLNMIPML
jgi:DNA mismatch repair protein PMS2